MNLIKDLLKKEKKLHFTLIDPDSEKQSPKDAGKIAKTCYDYGTDAIMIGGSTVNDKNFVYETVKEIKTSVDLPTILFPNSAKTIPENVDYIFFMILLNSFERKFIIEEQIKGAPIIRKSGIKPISMGYIVINTSKKPRTIETVCKLDMIKENDIDKVVNYALTAQYLNMECVYLEAGSGAEKPISNEMISEVRKVVDIPIIVGGGIRNGNLAKEKLNAGADVIVNGTIVENNCLRIKEIIDAIKTKR